MRLNLDVPVQFLDVFSNSGKQYEARSNIFYYLAHPDLVDGYNIRKALPRMLYPHLLRLLGLQVSFSRHYEKC